MRLSPEHIQMLKELATRHNRSNANMVETLIEAEYNKIKETETMNIELAIEHLQEMGKVCVDNVKHVKALQVELQNRGYSTQRINTDRDYLALDK